MEQLDLFKGHLNNSQNKRELPIPIQKQKTSKKIVDVLSGTLNYDFNNGKYSCYKIEVNNGKIIKIYFKIGNEKFLININYNFSNYINYSETDKEDREKINENIINLKIISIQKKVQNGYGELKSSVNYFKYLGIEYFSIKSFLEELIKNYHRIH